MELRAATIEDFVMPKFRGKDPKDYEIRHDGECVRKDRWEMCVQRIRELCGIKGNSDWEIKDVISAVEDMSNSEYPHCDFCEHEFEKEDINDLFHFSGVFRGKNNGHIHSCGECVEKYDLNTEFSFDERIEEIDGTRPLCESTS